MKSILPSRRSGVAFCHDVAMAAASFVLSVWLRMGNAVWGQWHSMHLSSAALLFTAVAAAVFLSLRLYRGVWRYASLRDMIALTRAVTLTVLIFLPALFVVTRLDQFPRSAAFINWFALLALLGGPRFVYRMTKDRRLGALRESADFRSVPVLLVGAGDPAELFIRATSRADAQYRPIGLLTDKRGRVGMDIHGIPILGLVEDLPQVVAALKEKGTAPERIILTIDNYAGAAVRGLLDRADDLGLPLSRLPKLTDLKDGISERLEIKPIDVEDLLGRPQTRLDHEAMRAMIRGRRVLVTGAGGSIGGELVRQISDCQPALLALAESSEFALYTIDMEIAGRHPDLPRLPLICDVRDAARLDNVFSRVQPELVFHAAALKHVPMVEGNPVEGLRTNALGTRLVADACRRHGVRVMVMISTDKAVNPTNVMGASKRLAEIYCQALDMAQGDTRYVTVRFGNVLGSTGSVVPLFQRQLAQGGPLTVTDPEMTRYFMTIREAVELVLQASVLGVGSKAYQGRIFVLDMGEPVKIVHLARQMIRLAGLKPDVDIKIVYTGLRPGEKLFEEIFHGAEAPVPTEAEGILVAAVRAGNPTAIEADLQALAQACGAMDLTAAMAVVRRLVPEYSGDIGLAPASEAAHGS